MNIVFKLSWNIVIEEIKKRRKNDFSKFGVHGHSYIGFRVSDHLDPISVALPLSINLTNFEGKIQPERIRGYNRYGIDKQKKLAIILA